MNPDRFHELIDVSESDAGPSGRRAPGGLFLRLRSTLLKRPDDPSFSANGSRVAADLDCGGQHLAFAAPQRRLSQRLNCGSPIAPRKGLAKALLRLRWSTQ